MFGKRKTVDVIDRAGNTVDALAPVVESAREKFGELSLDSELDGLSRELAAKAKKVLGYDTLSYRIKARDAREAALARLHSIGVKPFDDVKVAKYMNDRRKEDQKKLPKYEMAGWTCTYLSAYVNEVPQHILARAIEIKEKLPEVDIVVSHMTHTSVDPFLIVRISGNDFYVDVWDEPSFTGK